MRRTYAPRGQTPVLAHRLNWEHSSMAAALGYHATDAERGPRLCFHLTPGSDNTTTLIDVLEQLTQSYASEPVVLIWDGLPAHRSRVMTEWLNQQDWLTVERLPAYAPELNPVELLWTNFKNGELAHFASDRLTEIADTTESGINRICHDDQLPWSFLAHTGLTIHQTPHD
ncbi:transposase [Actinopolyspora halophila]|uniref:transposase n=1 Tax=Actinopolyspora halophila TaxID=1850 RepID=UPI001FDFA73E